MKNCILTPTFSGHFQYLKNYLDSFQENVTDKENTVIYFIVNESEIKSLRKILKKWEKLDLHILSFEDILRKFNIEISPEILLEKYGKFSFQALKKFYGMLYLEKYQHFLVLDTESIWLNKTSMNDMFLNFFEKEPFIIYSNVKKRLLTSKSNQEASDNINYILKSNCDKWFVEQYIRLWDVNILKDLFAKYGSCLEIVDRIYNKEKDYTPKLGLFESVLYDQFIYENCKKYGYKVIDLDQECDKYIDKKVMNKYRENLANIWNGSCGLLESSSILLDKSNYLGFANVFKNNNLNIIRIETEPQNYHWQKEFLKIVQPKILTCSQENLFGVNKNLKNFLIICRLKTKKLNKFLSMYNKIKCFTVKYFRIFISPFKFLLYFILGIFEFIRECMKFIFY